MGFWSDFKDKTGISRLVGSDDRSQARQLAKDAASELERGQGFQDDMLAVSDEQFSAHGELIDDLRQRGEEFYAPMEQSLVAKVSGAADLQGAADRAAGDYAGEYDNAIGIRDRQRQRQGVAFRPGSSGQMMEDGNDAYARAAGMATARTQARREEDDAHFIKQEAFYNRNGAGIQGQLMDNLNSMYTNRSNAYANQVNMTKDNAATMQSNSNALNAQSYNGIKTLAEIGTTAAKAAGMGA